MKILYVIGTVIVIFFVWAAWNHYRSMSDELRDGKEPWDGD